MNEAREKAITVLAIVVCCVVLIQIIWIAGRASYGLMVQEAVTEEEIRLLVKEECLR